MSNINQIRATYEEVKSKIHNDQDMSNKTGQLGRNDREPIVLSSDENNGMSCVYNSESPTAKTILITNNYLHNANNSNNQIKSSNNNIKKSSITIYTHNSDSEGPSSLPTSSGSTVVLDRINILINNHFEHPVGNANGTKMSSMPLTASDKKPNNALIKVEKCSSDEEMDDILMKKNLTTDTTTINTKSKSESKEIDTKFIIGEDVLVEQTDETFYLGTIIAVGQNKCLVKFDDNTDHWSTFNEIKRLNVSIEEIKPICVACKDTSDPNVVIEVCERCCRGYHKKCSQGFMDKSGIWYCKRYISIFKIKNQFLD